MTDYDRGYEDGATAVYDQLEKQANELARLRGEIQDMANEHNGGWVPRMEYDRLREDVHEAVRVATEAIHERDRLRDILDSPLGRATFPDALKETI